MSRKFTMLTSVFLLLSALNMASCSDDDVYRAPAVDDAQVITVDPTHGSPSTGWTVTGLNPGVYDLEFYSDWAGGTAEAYLTAAGKMTAIVPSANKMKKHMVRGIEIGAEGSCAISITNGEGVKVDNIKLLRNSSTRPFDLIKGGDISELSYIESKGGRYYDAGGNERDCLDLLAENGMNLVRIRLYNDPGNPDHYPSNTLPAGFEDVDDCLALAKRAHDKGMQILLSFHYSDYWTNGTDQYKPHEWAALDAAGLKDALYTYTHDVLLKFVEQGTVPQYVAIGNEIQAGMLYPEGAVANMKDFTDMLNAASRGVREAAPDARVIIHTDKGGDYTQAKWFFGEMRNHNVDYDIIGASYYPYWSQLGAQDVRMWADKIIDLYDKDIILMETGYAWNATLPGGYPGQLANNGPYNDMSQLGQRDFIADLSNEIKQVKSGRVLGYFYWDPIMIETPGVGWIVGGANIVSNTTLFDFEGKALPVLDAYRYNN